VQRRRLNAPRLPKKVRERILRDYVAGIDVTEIARRHRVAPSTVSNVALRHGVSRVPTTAATS
jgi:transposase-like protein